MVSTFASTCIQHFVETNVQCIWTSHPTLLKTKKLLKACWKRVESSLNWFKLSFNIDPIFPLFLKMLNGLFRRFQHLPNICSTFVEQMFVKCWNCLIGPLRVKGLKSNSKDQIIFGRYPCNHVSLNLLLTFSIMKTAYWN